MYLHLGQDVVVSKKSVVGVFDLETTTISKLSREFLTAAQRRGEVVNISEELPKSYIICRKNGKTILYISQISTATLLRRSRQPGFPAVL